MKYNQCSLENLKQCMYTFRVKLKLLKSMKSITKKDKMQKKCNKRTTRTFLYLINTVSTHWLVKKLNVNTIHYPPIAVHINCSILHVQLFLLVKTISLGRVFLVNQYLQSKFELGLLMQPNLRALA